MCDCVLVMSCFIQNIQAHSSQHYELTKTKPYLWRMGLLASQGSVMNLIYTGKQDLVLCWIHKLPCAYLHIWWCLKHVFLSTFGSVTILLIIMKIYINFALYILLDYVWDSLNGLKSGLLRDGSCSSLIEKNPRRRQRQMKIYDNGLFGGAPWDHGRVNTST